MKVSSMKRNGEEQKANVKERTRKFSFEYKIVTGERRVRAWELVYCAIVISILS